MALYKRQVKASFSPVIYARGKKYYEQGRVQNLASNKEGRLEVISGHVLGSSHTRYFVESWIDDDEFISECECGDGTQCKHGVALILEAYEDGLFIEPGGKKAVAFTKPSSMQRWFDNVQQEKILPATKKDDEEPSEEQFLIYTMFQGVTGLEVEVKRTKYNKKGEINKGVAVHLKNMHRDILDKVIEDFLDAKDCEIFSNMTFNWDDSSARYEIFNAARAQVLIKMIQTGRCFWQNTESQSIDFNSKKDDFEFKWSDEAPYALKIQINGRTDFQLLPTTPLFYLNINTHELGQLDSQLNQQIINHLRELPILNEDDAKQFSMWLFDSNLPIPTPVDLNIVEVGGDFDPILKISFDEKDNQLYGQYMFKYGDFVVEHDDYDMKSPIVFTVDEKLHRWQRDLVAEKQGIARLQEAGLSMQAKTFEGKVKHVFTSNDSQYWLNFAENTQPNLETLGWKIELNDIELPKIHEIDQADGSVSSDDTEFDNWFELGLSINLNGEKIDLVPLLIDGLANIKDWDDLPDKILVPNKQDFLQFNKADIEPIIRVLSQLASKDGKLNKYNAGVLNHIPFVNKWSGNEKIQSLAQKLNDFSGIKDVKPPEGLNAELRDYQQQGLDWLGFLIDYEFGGILADDMGLGKTVQTLAMMLVLHNRKQITSPIMVVCPTSLIGNWRSEANKFAPALKVLVLHGANRHALFEQIEDYDLIVTTYPLVQRDIEQHNKINWLWLVLDEAQVIKNPKAKMTQAIKTLKAKHRLCLTGTPMENHLGELWSLFDFLMPGFLNNHKSFNETYRRPIEAGDAFAQNWLNERVKPFLLRRTKDAVATELPSKTVIIQRLDMAPDQRKLYESIRVTMEKRVRQLLKEKGMAKSQIEFLDALLKLRQACCHPELVKLDEARKVSQSTKMDFLLEVLPGMIEEGRKVLIFSQFAQMLGIIEEQLAKHNIKTTKLTGQTRNREHVINVFTSG
ncbi:MAG: DEAD/DEAH box helicase family protein, partial [Saccharospirillaceae bacterium]|nr:DEAD/DEAH box helicase family protein [Saccharospirillaceae bacterium]